MTNKKAVLCDDDKTTTLIIKHLLEKLGFSVSMAANGKEGLALIQAEAPQLLILDLDMPVKNGMGVLQDLQPSGKNGPYIIVLSAHENQEDHAQVQALGAQEVVVKPFKPADLVKKVEALVKEGKI